MRKWVVIAASVTLLSCLPALAQDVQVRGSVNHTTIGAQEAVIFSLEVDGATLSSLETPAPPETEGLGLLQTAPSVQRNMSLINGRLEQSVVFRWSYRPLREGAARIGAAAVTVDGRTYSSDPIDITVVSQSQRSPRGGSQRQQWPFVSPSQPSADEEAAQAVAPEDLFIRAVPSARSAMLNEQVTVEYQLFFRDGVQLRHSRLAGSWDAEGFWREEFNVDTRPVPTSIVENGIHYHMIVLKRVAVFPTRPGTLTVEPLEIETEAYLPVSGADAFQRFFGNRGQFETVDLSSDPVVIEVDALPDGAPAAFGGAVGSFDVSSSVSKTEAEVGEPLQLSVTIRGSGNVATLAAPDFDPPGIFERYDPNVESVIDRDGARIGGRKTFEYVLIPRSNGSFDLPPVSFTYFDPRSNEYVTDRAELPTVHVTGAAAPLAAGTTSDGLPVDDIAGLMLAASDWNEVDSAPLHKQAWPYAALALPATLLLALFVRQRRADRLAGDPRLARNRMAHPLAQKHLREARRLLSDEHPRAFYEEIERAVRGFIGNRLDVAETGLTRDQLDSRLRTLGLDEAGLRLLKALLDECDQARFAPVLPDRSQMESAHERAAHLIVEIDRAAAEHSEQSSTAA